MVTVVDVGLGNVASVANMLRRLNADVVMAPTPQDWDENSPLILPGVGAWDTGIARLEQSGWFGVLADLPESHPILGICLGMQLLGEGSEEGTRRGLARVPAHFVRIDEPGLPVPHVGWNVVDFIADDPVVGPLPSDSRYYFTHSFRAAGKPEVIGSTEYGSELVAAYRAGNTYGTQFHPEKSHRFGLALLRSWLDCAC